MSAPEDIDANGSRKSGNGIYFSEPKLTRRYLGEDDANDSIADIFSLLQSDTLLNPQFYPDDRSGLNPQFYPDDRNGLEPEFYTEPTNSIQAISAIKYLLSKATNDFAELRNNSTTDQDRVAKLRDALEEDIGRIQNLFERLSRAARFKGDETQSNVPTVALTRASIGEAVLSTNIQRVTSKLTEASKLVHKAAIIKLGPSRRRLR